VKDERPSDLSCLKFGVETPGCRLLGTASQSFKRAHTNILTPVVKVCGQRRNQLDHRARRPFKKWRWCVCVCVGVCVCVCVCV
jgi:hypothetical protein